MSLKNEDTKAESITMRLRTGTGSMNGAKMIDYEILSAGSGMKTVDKTRGLNLLKIRLTV